jgi:GH15 family glucan-1,4-alpha-glucosidase
MTARGRSLAPPVGRPHPVPHVLRDYALLADGHRGVVVGPDGSCDWMCFPTWADDALFASLIGSGGHFIAQPVGRYVSGGYYQTGTLIWTCRFATTDGIFESRDALAYPGEPGRLLLLRRLRAVDGTGKFFVALDPRLDYGRRAVGPWRREAEAWTARGEGARVSLWGAEQARPQPFGNHHRLELELAMKPGEDRHLVLEVAGAGTAPGPPPVAEVCWQATERAWRESVPDCTGMVAAPDVRLGYALLRGMTSPGGGTVAAATTSLPEQVEGTRNYDYRYVWVRDSCYVGRAGAAVPGGEEMLDDAVRFVCDRLVEDGDQLAPAYLAGGGRVPRDQPLDLPGYPGGSDVVGNRIRDQFQLDTFGEALLLLALARDRDRLTGDAWKAAEIAAAAVERRWQEADSGIWELGPRHWAHSKLICVAGLRAICRGGAPAPFSSRYLALADRILAEVAETSVHRTGRWQRAPDDERVDAALLLAQVRGALEADDPRSVATRRAVASELGSDGYVYRYRHGDGPLGRAEGAFLVCGFWLALASFQAGDLVDGVRWFERGRSAAGSPGLFAEEFDVEQHQARGNLPQAFVHALMMECAGAQTEWGTG